uniref:Si:ch211-284o19.8 n=1 Tax=Sphaeramia orbicularis TaxID=375764 RepID=A0A673B5S6_9TELE
VVTDSSTIEIVISGNLKHTGHQESDLWKEEKVDFFINSVIFNCQKSLFFCELIQFYILWYLTCFTKSISSEKMKYSRALKLQLVYSAAFSFSVQVFSILTLQLLFTFSVVCLFTFSSVIKEAVQTHLWAYLSSFIIFAVVAIALTCCQSFSRRHPWNIVGLVIVTLSLSYMVGTIASFHNTNAVVITMASTLVISFAIILFSIQTRFDFTICYGVALILVVDLLMFGFFCTFYYSYMADVAYGCLGALLYSLFLMIDCQLLMGTFSYRLNPEEYVNAALMIYLDIILIFLYLLGRR